MDEECGGDGHRFFELLLRRQQELCAKVVHGQPVPLPPLRKVG